ncbi:MAG: dependent oxidoreductase [Deltaproteobacteria bacterium]|nr:dependent oxidoreductase [Deltaproteobacteria bacterium]
MTRDDDKCKSTLSTFPGQSTADVVICGAGIAGISAAYHLAVRQGIKGVVVVDERPPLSLTSDKSTECYRNLWPGPRDAMVGLMNRSLDIMEELARESSNIFHLTRRGYLYATANPKRIPHFERFVKEASELGVGPVRYHDRQRGDSSYIPHHSTGFDNEPSGVDLILDSKIIQRHFPYLSRDILAVIHGRRCGWLSVQQLGMYMLERARENKVRLIAARVENITVADKTIRAVHLRKGSRAATISTRHFINAAGPLLREVGLMVGVDLPVFSELHLKMAFKDTLGAVPRNAPMLIGTDPLVLPWTEEERAVLAQSEETRSLLEELPSGVHTRPEGGPDSDVLLGLWPYHTPPTEPVFPFSTDPGYPEMVLRGLSTMIPGLRGYVERVPKATVDGGYYTKTRENRPLIGKLPVEGGYVVGALSGFGVMAACGAGELVAAHVVAGKLPHYASAFALERYEDPDYQRLLDTWNDSGQL